MPDLFLIAPTGGSPVRVSGVAYTGGKMDVGQWKEPIVVDLAGLEIPESVPLLANHENRTSARVGLIRARIQDGVLMVDGEIVSSSGTAEGIIEQARAGAEWQLSIGAEVTEYELVEIGARTVNGKSHTAPFCHITKSVLREVSVIPVGADSQTRLRIAAALVLSVDASAKATGDARQMEHDMNILKLFSKPKDGETEAQAESRLSALVAAFGEGQGEFVAACHRAGHDVAAAIVAMREQHAAALEAKQKDVERLNAENTALMTAKAEAEKALAGARDAEKAAQAQVKTLTAKVDDLEKRPPVHAKGGDTDTAAEDDKKVLAAFDAGTKAARR